MKNKDLIIKLLDSNLDEEVDLQKTVGKLTFKPAITAKWVKEKGSQGQIVVCSRCECRVSRVSSIKMNYCFMCGAKMEREG